MRPQTVERLFLSFFVFPFYISLSRRIKDSALSVDE